MNMWVPIPLSAAPERPPERSKPRSPHSYHHLNAKATKWAARPLQQQLLGVVRHAERADCSCTLVNGVPWTTSEDFRCHPFDPPLSDCGMQQAKGLALKVRGFVDKSAGCLHVVVCSPYFRCVQTAVEVCQLLGPGTRMLLDRAVGEVYGPCVFGAEEPDRPTRPMEEVLAYCRANGVSCQPLAVGKRPTWPETVQDARRRFACRYLTYMHRSAKTQRNFLMVSHGDSVGATLSLMPPVAGQIVEKVEYGSAFLARRTLDAAGAALGGNAGPGRPPSAPPALRGDAGDVDPLCLAANDPADEPLAPTASDGWEIETYGMALVEWEDGSSALSKRTRALARISRFSEDRIAFLLGNIAKEPLGSSCQLGLDDDDDRLSNISRETYIFGASGRSETESNYSWTSGGISMKSSSGTGWGLVPAFSSEGSDLSDIICEDGPVVQTERTTPSNGRLPMKRSSAKRGSLFREQAKPALPPEEVVVCLGPCQGKGPDLKGVLGSSLMARRRNLPPLAGGRPLPGSRGE